MQIKKGIRKDGEYLLNIKGRMIKVLLIFMSFYEYIFLWNNIFLIKILLKGCIFFSRFIAQACT